MGEDYYIRLIYKQIGEELTEQEGKKLVQWLDENEEHCQIAADIQEVFELTGDYKAEEIEAIDVDKALEAQLQLIGEEPQLEQQKDKKQRRVRRMTRMRRIAVAAVLALCAVVAWQVIMPSTSNGTMIEVVADQQKQEVKLPDGTTVFLTEKSRIAYQKDFKGKQRNVELKGEGVFEVAKDPNKPFIVKSAQGTVEVLGTVFDLKAEGDVLDLKVLEGKVRFTLKNSTKSIDAVANQRVIGNVSAKNIRKEELTTANDLAWYNGILKFEETPLLEATALLAKQYEVSITLDGLKNCPINGTFDNKELSYILNTIKKALDCQIIQQNDSTYIIKGDSCE